MKENRTRDEGAGDWRPMQRYFDWAYMAMKTRLFSASGARNRGGEENICGK
jgi:hypothetical protein